MCGRRLADIAKTLSDGMIEYGTLDPGERDISMDGVTNPSRRGQLRHHMMVPALPDAFTHGSRYTVRIAFTGRLSRPSAYFSPGHDNAVYGKGPAPHAEYPTSASAELTNSRKRGAGLTMALVLSTTYIH